jgi:hypothetical protein
MSASVPAHRLATVWICLCSQSPYFLLNDIWESSEYIKWQTADVRAISEIATCLYLTNPILGALASLRQQGLTRRFLGCDRRPFCQFFSQ